MSKLEELIQELCPDGVEYVRLDNVSSIYDGTHQTPNYTNEGVKFISVENIHSPYNSLKKISSNDFDQLYRIKPRLNDVIMTRIGSIGECFVLDKDEPLAFYVTLALIRPNHSLINSRFLKYGIECSYGKKQLWKRTLHYATPIKINLGEIGKISIPLPPLPVQEEIVRILDKFTALEAELEAELEARKKQYEYYRASLLSNSDKSVKRKQLGSLGRVRMCKRIMKSQTTSAGVVPFYKIGTFGKQADAYISKELFEEFKANYSFPKNGEILISAAGTIGRTVIYDGEPAYFQDSNIVWLENDESEVLNKYLFYIYATSPWYVSNGGTISRLYNDNIEKAKIPVPSIPEQTRIVSILDRFDSLVNDITQGLPAELAARRKQYEYYRDKLLTFKEKVS